MKQTYQIRVKFVPHPTQHLLMPVAEVMYSTFSSMETLFSIEGQPGKVSESDVRELLHRTRHLVYDYTEIWEEVNTSWDQKTSEYVTVNP